MKRRAFLTNLISLFLVLFIVCAVGITTVFAEPEDPAPAVADEGAEQPAADPAETPQEEPWNVPAEQPEEQPEEQPAEQAQEPSYAPIYEYIYGYSEEMTSAYEEPENLGDLPQVNAGEVVEATAVVIPDIAVSDASMFSGIVMWLCVALGIAVIVGVLVSKRTRRRGA